MAAAFAALPEAVANTVAIAERCNVELTLRPLSVPGLRDAVAARASRSISTARRARASRGACAKSARRRTGRRTRRASYRERLEFELATIREMGFAGLFPDRRRLHRLGQAARDPRGSGPRIRRRQSRRVRARHHRYRSDPVQVALRALPQSGAQVACPISTSTSASTGATRSSQYVKREIRRRSRRADHRLRHAQGQAGDQGRRPRPRLHITRRPIVSASSIRRRSKARTTPSRRRSRSSRGCARCATRAAARRSCSRTR